MPNSEGTFALMCQLFLLWFMQSKQHLLTHTRQYTTKCKMTTVANQIVEYTCQSSQPYVPQKQGENMHYILTLSKQPHVSHTLRKKERERGHIQ